MRGQYVIGIDFGSDSVRAILVDTKSAQTLQTAVAEYPRWKEKKYCDDKISQYRQHPMDYLECMEQILEQAKGAYKVAFVGRDCSRYYRFYSVPGK